VPISTNLKNISVSALELNAVFSSQGFHFRLEWAERLQSQDLPFLK